MVLTLDEIHNALSAKLGHDEFVVETFSFEDIDTLHFHSNNHVAHVTAKVGQQVEEFSFFVKSVNTDCEIYKRFLGPAKMFEKEHSVLTAIIPQLQTIAPNKITCECYLSNPFKCIVLENLTQLGFKPLGKFVDAEHARVAVKALANLHVASIIKEETDGVNLGEKFKDFNYETLIVSKYPPEESLIHSVDTRLRKLGRQFMAHLSPETQEKLFHRLRKALVELSKPSTRFRNVITQGDPWGANLLYKYDENDKPREALLVDFQVARYGPPAQELFMFLHAATPSSNFISEHSSEFTELYYDCLSQFLSEKDIEISRILPKDEFLNSCEVYKEFGIAARVYYASNTRLPPKYMEMLFESPTIYCDFMVAGSFEIAVDAYKNDAEYRKEIDEPIEAALQFYKDL